MKIFTTLIASAFLSTCTVSAADCVNGPFQADMLMIGGNGGDVFCETRYNEGLFIKGIEVWSTSGDVRGIKLKYSNDDFSRVYGSIIDNNGDYHQRMEWDPLSVNVEALTLWGNGIGTRVGRIEMRLSDGQTLNVGKNPDKNQRSYHMDIGAGVMLGVYGNSGADMDAIGFLLLRSKIQKIAISDVVFDKDLEVIRSQRMGIAKQTLQEGSHTNNLDVNTTYEFRRERTERDSHKTISSTTHTIGAKVSWAFEASLPIFVKNTFTVEASWQMAIQRTTEDDKSTEVKLMWGTIAIVMPGRTVYCSAWTEQGVFDSEYTSTVTITLADTSSYKFKERGQYKSISWGDAQSKCWYQDETGGIVAGELEPVPLIEPQG